MTAPNLSKMKTVYSFFVLFSVYSSIFAQQYEGKINAVPTSGLHRIVIPPEVRALSLNNNNHIRIYDAHKNEVPYILYTAKSTSSNFEPFPIVAKNTVTNVATSILVANTKRIPIEDILLKIANTDVVKKYNISGSNDSLQWFGLVNNASVRDLHESDKTSVDRIFSFPLNDYKFLKFDFMDDKSLPINVLSAGRLKHHTYVSPEVSLTNFKQTITTDKKSKTTKIDIVFASPQVIDGIQFDISQPNHYVRAAQIFEYTSRIRKQEKEIYLETISTLELNSKTGNKFQFKPILSSQLTIEIHNADNPELHINKIIFFQKPISIITDIQANENYSLVIDTKNTAPNYDLAASQINFSQDFPMATIVDIKALSTPKVAAVAVKQPFWQTPTFMWTCMVIAVVLLAYFSLGIIRDLSKKD